VDQRKGKLTSTILSYPSSPFTLSDSKHLDIEQKQSLMDLRTMKFQVVSHPSSKEIQIRLGFSLVNSICPARVLHLHPHGSSLVLNISRSIQMASDNFHLEK
jgi:hypothetical protein